MADPYYSYALPITRERADLRAVFPGYLPSDGSSRTPNHTRTAHDLRGTSDYLGTDLLPRQSVSNGLVDLAGVGDYASGGGYATGVNMRSFTPLEDPSFMSRDAPLGSRPAAPDVERSSPLLNPDGLSGGEPNILGESNILYVDCLPTDCTRREVAHLFRPFIGFKDIKVVHKEARRTGDKAYVLCFVEFSDAKCALTALEALQGYRFDDKKPDAPVLKIEFAKFPFRPPSVGADGRHGNAH